MLFPPSTLNSIFLRLLLSEPLYTKILVPCPSLTLRIGHGDGADWIVPLPPPVHAFRQTVVTINWIFLRLP